MNSGNHLGIVLDTCSRSQHVYQQQIRLIRHIITGAPRKLAYKGNLRQMQQRLLSQRARYHFVAFLRETRD